MRDQSLNQIRHRDRGQLLADGWFACLRHDCRISPFQSRGMGRTGPARRTQRALFRLLFGRPRSRSSRCNGSAPNGAPPPDVGSSIGCDIVRQMRAGSDAIISLGITKFRFFRAQLSSISVPLRIRKTNFLYLNANDRDGRCGIDNQINTYSSMFIFSGG